MFERIKPEIYAGLGGGSLPKRYYVGLEKKDKFKNIARISSVFLDKLSYCEDINYLVYSQSRKFEEVKIKHILYYQLYKKELFTLTDIGNFFRRHHSTILHGINRVKDAIDIKEKSIINLLKLIETNERSD